MEEKGRLSRVRVDLIGRKFGRLTVLERASDILKTKKNNKVERCACWKCKCECGKDVIVKGSSLKGGSTKSCGCLHIDTAQQIGKKNGIELVGKTFSLLTIVKREKDYISPRGVKVPRWLCKCKCGNEVITTYSKLKAGITKSCGCIRFDDLTGNRFGKLTALSRIITDDMKKKKTTYWLCQCDCGNTTIVAAANLKREDKSGTKSCGCVKSFNEQRIREYLTSREIEHIKEYSFENRLVKNLRFDFAVVSYGEIVGLIEFDGEHHYHPVKYGGCTFEQAKQNYLRQVKRDKSKDRFCKTKNIPLLRVSYLEEKRLIPILDEFISKLNLDIGEKK